VHGEGCERRQRLAWGFCAATVDGVCVHCVAISCQSLRSPMEASKPTRDAMCTMILAASSTRREGDMSMSLVRCVLKNGSCIAEACVLAI